MHLNHNLSDKKHLFANMKDYLETQGKSPFSLLPVTYVIENGLNDPEFDKFEANYREIQ